MVRSMLVAGRILLARPVGQMRGQRRHLEALAQDRFGPRGPHAALAQHPGILHPLQHPVTRRLRRPGVQVGPARAGRLRQRHQQRGFGRGQPARRLAEIGQAGGADPFQVAAEGCAVEVERQDLVLVQPPLQRQRHADLPQLAAPGAGAAILDQPRHLHGQGRGARDDAAGAQQLPPRAGHGARVDAVMVAKPPVLVADQHLDIGRVHRIEPDRQPPAPVSHRIGAQQLAVAVQHLDRLLGDQRRQHRGVNPAVRRVAARAQTPKRQRARCKQTRGPAAHSAMTTLPGAVRARICGRYMSSTLAAG